MDRFDPLFYNILMGHGAGGHSYFIQQRGFLSSMKEGYEILVEHNMIRFESAPNQVGKLDHHSHSPD